MVWQEKNDSIQGYIYLLRVKDFHGWIPGAVLGRYKIDLSSEYFDLNPLQVQHCLWLMRRYESRR